MCGIAGEFIFHGPTAVDPAVLVAMRDRMAHRGPDDAGAWLAANGRVGLGHRRLSIVDLSPAGHQPMSNEDGTIWITFNGEIYNHRDLRAPLEKAGHQYHSQTDTETIIHLYEEHGDDCLKMLDGMFALAIWDVNRQRLLVARDPLGKKPLYFWRDNDRLVFASEIKALLKHPCVPKRVDPAALYHYLSLSATPPPLTMFTGIQKLKPAEAVVIERDGGIRSSSYWNPFAGPSIAPDATESELTERLLTLLSKSIEKRMMADVPFGVFLSGGVDSSTNVALMSRLMTRPVDTFSVALSGDAESDEFAYARQIARQFGCNHHEITVTPAMFLEFAEQMPYFQDEPLADPVCVPLYYVSKLARDHGVIVVQVGEGSDEIFAGYDGYRDVLRRQRWAQRWRQWVPAAVQNLAVTLAPSQSADLLRRLRDEEEIFWGAAVAFYETEKRQMLVEAPPLSTWSQIAPHYERALAEGGDIDFLQQMIYVELKQRLAELLLMRVDKMAMATSVEARVPFLDDRLVEFAMQLPSKFKVHNGTGKYLLKKAASTFLPAEIVQRPKRGFCGSAFNMLHGPIMDRLIADVRASRFLAEWIRAGAVEKLAADPRANAFKLWNLWNLALWHRCWFE